MRALIRLTSSGARHAADPALAPARPGGIAADNRDLITKLADEPDNVRVYRFVRT